jgi:hypothetical protein
MWQARELRMAHRAQSRGVSGRLMAAGAALHCSRPAAADAPATQPAATDAPPLASEDWLETTRRSVRSGTEWLARVIDSWFGDRPLEQGGQVSDGLRDVHTLYRPDTGSCANVRLNARLRLPNVEKFGYFIGLDGPRDVVTDTPEAFSNSQRLINDPFGEDVGGRFWQRPDPAQPRGRAWAIGASFRMRVLRPRIGADARVAALRDGRDSQGPGLKHHGHQGQPARRRPIERPRRGDR